VRPPHPPLSSLRGAASCTHPTAARISLQPTHAPLSPAPYAGRQRSISRTASSRAAGRTCPPPRPTLSRASSAPRGMAMARGGPRLRRSRRACATSRIRCQWARLRSASQCLPMRSMRCSSEALDCNQVRRLIALARSAAQVRRSAAGHAQIGLACVPAAAPHADRPSFAQPLGQCTAVFARTPCTATDATDVLGTNEVRAAPPATDVCEAPLSCRLAACAGAVGRRRTHHTVCSGGLAALGRAGRAGAEGVRCAPVRGACGCVCV